MTAEWPGPDALRRLPDNHRRALRSTLVSLVSKLPALVEAGAVAAGPDDILALRELLDTVDPVPARRNLDAVRIALLVQSEELAPHQMERYGHLDAASRADLEALTARLRAVLAPGHGKG